MAEDNTSIKPHTFHANLHDYRKTDAPWVCDPNVNISFVIAHRKAWLGSHTHTFTIKIKACTDKFQMEKSWLSQSKTLWEPDGIISS